MDLPCFTVFALSALSALPAPPQDAPLRSVADLAGPYEITTGDPSDPAASWLAIQVPATFETALGDDFDGVATYRLRFTVPDGFAGERLLLEFQGAATAAHVWLNDELLGTHLGAWTTFRLDATEVIARSGPNTLLVMLDEKVGHNTQGFLPVIAPHFGGLWQPVRLLGVADPHVNDLGLLAVGDPETGRLVLEAPLAGAGAGAAGLAVTATAVVEGREFSTRLDAGRGELVVTGHAPWDVSEPRLYPVTFRLARDGREIDRVTMRAAFRSIATRGRTLLLNDRPLNVRGMLEWGYFPPSLAPYPSDEAFRSEIRACRERGFNLIKFCLFVPPRRLLHLLDEEGMLAWMEYPTWHPVFDGEHLEELRREFDEFFAHDRNHPAVVLRSLTCETGPSASLAVIQALYDRAKARIPGALVVDDSSWISWNRVFDFYDDHPYGNNKDWPARLDALNDYIDAREARPLVLGEAIAADTWLDQDQRDAVPAGAWWRSIHHDAAREFEERIAARFGADTVADLRPHSLAFALAQRKDQVETFRLLVPAGGYVISVARDFSKAEMGLADHRNEPKWPAADWNWHGDTMLVLGRGTPRSVRSGAAVELPLILAHHGRKPLPKGQVIWSYGALAASGPEVAQGAVPGQRSASWLAAPEVEPGSVIELGTIAVAALPGNGPVRGRLAARQFPAGAFNHWPLWTVPAPEAPGADGVEEVEALDSALFQRLLDGARVLLHAGNRPGSFSVRPHWLLRGSLWFPPHPLRAQIPPEFYLDLLVKDLHPDGLLPVAALFDSIDPLVAFWDSHDLAEIKPWALVFETRAGKGKLLVSALPRDGSPAAEFLHSALRAHLAGDHEPTAAFGDDWLAAIADRLAARTLDLTAHSWQFRPEPAGAPPGAWSEIRVGRSWESQGHGALDGHARYALEFELPPDWAGEPLHLNFDGVDDAYTVFFDGAERGAGGDVENRVTAFDQRASHLLAEAAAAGRHRLEVLVFDWYGAGGIHRPVSLSTRPLGAAAEFLEGR